MVSLLSGLVVHCFILAVWLGGGLRLILAFCSPRGYTSLGRYALSADHKGMKQGLNTLTMTQVMRTLEAAHDSSLKPIRY